MRRTLVSLILLGAVSLPALAHEKGSIRLASRQVPVGGELVLRGERLPKNATLTLQLRGTLENFPLGAIRADSSGAAQGRIALPGEARMGAYKVVVLAPDGEVVAQTDLVIVAPAAGAMSAEEHAAMNTSPTATEQPHATAELMKLDVKTTPVEWAVIAVIVVASAAAGFVLLAGARPS